MPPVRTCAGCHGKDEKGHLVRVVRQMVDRTNIVVVDGRQRLPGRGAYVHATDTCIERAVRKGGLARVLKTAVPGSLVEALKSTIGDWQGST